MIHEHISRDRRIRNALVERKKRRSRKVEYKGAK
jgi:hypothetical protein